MNLLTETSSQNIFQWAKKFNRPYILDGGVGCIVQSKYPLLYHHGIWMNRALTEHPEFIENLHSEYINSGADIITTFTFRTNPYSLALYDETKHSSEELVKIAVNLCKEAKKKVSEKSHPVLIAGSNTTMVDCYYGILKDIKDEEIYENHQAHMQNLMKEGCDFILNETFGHLREIKIVCEICQKLKIPSVMSIYCDENLKLLSGESLQEALDIIKQYGLLAVSFNCIKYSTMKKIISDIDLKNMIWGCYINCGDEKMQETYAKLDGEVEVSVLDFAVSPDELKKFSEDIVNTYKLKPGFIGSCCCSNPEHTKKLLEIFQEKF